MVVGKARELNKSPYSNISLDLHPPIEKAPECPQSPRSAARTSDFPQSPLAAPESWTWEGAQAPAQPPHCPAWIFHIYFSLPSFELAAVNLPFSKFNKTLIEKKKKRIVISSPTIKGQLTSQFSSGQEKKSGPQGETQFCRAVPLRSCSPAVSRVLCPSLSSSWVLFPQLQGKQEFTLHYWWLLPLSHPHSAKEKWLKQNLGAVAPWHNSPHQSITMWTHALKAAGQEQLEGRERGLALRGTQSIFQLIHLARELNRALTPRPRLWSRLSFLKPSERADLLPETPNSDCQGRGRTHSPHSDGFILSSSCSLPFLLLGSFVGFTFLLLHLKQLFHFLLEISAEPLQMQRLYISE